MKPLILDYKEHRQDVNRPVKYSYNATLAMNTVYVDGEEKTFIDVASDDLQFMTKTKVRPESDDDSNLNALNTKTRVSTESDDERYLNELETKTFVKAERDDEKQTHLN